MFLVIVTAVIVLYVTWTCLACKVLNELYFKV